jgi:hypothetical protein
MAQQYPLVSLTRNNSLGQQATKLEALKRNYTINSISS